MNVRTLNKIIQKNLEEVCFGMVAQGKLAYSFLTACEWEDEKYSLI